MTKKKFSGTEKILVVFLLLLAIGASWYLFFYKPLTAEIAEINTKTDEINSNIKVQSAKLGQMNTMKKELDEIFAENENPSEIAAFDNSQAVMNQLNTILSGTNSYNLSFANPSGSDIVRRTVSMSFTVDSYEMAKQILIDLEQNHWRCLVNTVTISGSNSNSNVLDGGVSVSASIVFFESTKIDAAEPAA